MRDFVGNVMVDTQLVRLDGPKLERYETMVVKTGSRGKPTKESWANPLEVVSTKNIADALVNHAKMIEKYK